MSWSEVNAKPVRMHLCNIATRTVLEAQFNPTTFEERLEVVYAQKTVPGLSHQPLQYVNTSNVTIPLILRFNIFEAGVTVEQLLFARRFLQATAYPLAGGSVPSSAPPRILFVWPKIISMTCVLRRLTFKHERFDNTGAPIEFSAQLVLEEIRDFRLISADVFERGSQRSPDRREQT